MSSNTATARERLDSMLSRRTVLANSKGQPERIATGTIRNANDLPEGMDMGGNATSTDTSGRYYVPGITQAKDISKRFNMGSGTSAPRGEDDVFQNRLTSDSRKMSQQMIDIATPEDFAKLATYKMALDSGEADFQKYVRMNEGIVQRFSRVNESRDLLRTQGELLYGTDVGDKKITREDRALTELNYRNSMQTQGIDGSDLQERLPRMVSRAMGDRARQIHDAVVARAPERARFAEDIKDLHEDMTTLIKGGSYQTEFRNKKLAMDIGDVNADTDAEIKKGSEGARRLLAADIEDTNKQVRTLMRGGTYADQRKKGLLEAHQRSLRNFNSGWRQPKKPGIDMTGIDMPGASGLFNLFQ